MTEPGRPLRWLLRAALAVAWAGLAWAVVSLAPSRPEPPDVPPHGGVDHPVTAVLLDFRGYDTLLELAVLLLALAGAWSLRPAPAPRPTPPGPILGFLARLLAPVMLLVAAYLLWLGAHAPGGAFQAGAVLGGAAVLLGLAGWRPPPALTGRPLRLAALAGVAVFAAVGVATMAGGAPFLSYPPDWSGSLILLIETAATIAIGVTLAALFHGGPPEGRP